MAQKVIVPQKKIMSRSFLNSGTLIVKEAIPPILNHFFPIVMNKRFVSCTCTIIEMGI
jgi:hypothetical protein